MTANHNLEKAATFLAQNNFEAEDGLERIIWLRQDAGDEIRLVEVNRNGFPLGRVEAFYFSPSEDVPFETYLADITPEEWQKVLTGELSLPAGWSLEGSTEFLRPKSASTEMQTTTLKKATEDLGISLENIVSYHKQGNKALIEIDLKFPMQGRYVQAEAIAAK